MPDDTRDRVIRVEADMAHLNESVEQMSKKLDEIHNAFTKAKGAKWMLLALAGAGGLIGGKLGGLLPFLK